MALVAGTAENTATAEISPDECREQLRRIVESSDFELPERGRRFLSYIVEETLQGRSDRIKAYAIATEVFGRGQDFDPQSDPIVRIEAGQLRRALERYHLKAGQADPITITIPKGRYVPEFSRRPQVITDPPVVEPAATPRLLNFSRATKIWTAAVAAMALAAVVFFVMGRQSPRPDAPDIPRLLVTPFQNLSGAPEASAIATGLTQEVIGQISKFKDIAVIAARPGVPTTVVPASSGGATDPRFALDGSVALTADSLRLQVSVTSRDDGRVLWANTYEGNLKVVELLQMESDIARQVATAIAQPYGIIYQADLSRKVENPAIDWEAYACTLAYYDYRTTLDAKRHPIVRKCLEKAVAEYPNYATAWALLSQTYIDEIRFRYAPDPVAGPPSIEKALDAARRAVELDPQNVRGLEAEMFALYFSKQIDAALKIGEQALKINPNDTEMMGEYGYRLALSGDWDRGCPLVAEVRDRNPGPLAYYESALALCSYFHGDYPQAAMWIKKTTAPDNPNYHVIAAAIFGEGGYTADAARERDWLTTNSPTLVSNLRAAVSARFAKQSDIDQFLASLKKAGLPVAD